MYLTVKETAEYLELTEAYIEELIRSKKIRVVFDGEQYVINREQFNHHMEQMEKMKLLLEEENSEPIPEDIDYKDED